MKKIVRQFETDWLASRPVFYNTKTAKAGYNINDVIDFSDIEFHPEGFNNYLDFGYSVLEQTPIKYVKFMRHSSILRIYENNSLEIEYLPDPVENWFGKTTNEDDVLDLIKMKVSKWEEKVTGEIVLPLSGGFDSRLLASMISDKSRLRCFTYGLSSTQSESFEVIHAGKIAELLHLQWQQIELGDYLNYFDEWNCLFGVSTHSHGMYHIEFYKRMLKEYSGCMNFLSGIFGDVWAGNVKTQAISRLRDIIKLGYTHGLSASSEYSILPHENTILQTFYNGNKDKLQYIFYQIITTIRLKIILISYLVSVPESFGFSVFAPFLDMEIALSMLCLQEDRWKNRQWQKDYFKKKKLDIESINMEKSFENNLGIQAAQRVKLQPLNYEFYSALVQKSYIIDINNIYNDINKVYSENYPLFSKLFDNIVGHLSKIKLFRRLHLIGVLYRLRKLIGIKNKNEYYALYQKKYSAYLTLKPFEYIYNKAEKMHCNAEYIIGKTIG